MARLLTAALVLGLLVAAPAASAMTPPSTLQGALASPLEVSSRDDAEDPPGDASAATCDKNNAFQPPWGENPPEDDPSLPPWAEVGARTYSVDPSVLVIPHGGSGTFTFQASAGHGQPLSLEVVKIEGAESNTDCISDADWNDIGPRGLPLAHWDGPIYRWRQGADGPLGEYSLPLTLYSNRVDGPTRLEKWLVTVLIVEGSETWWEDDDQRPRGYQTNLQVELHVQHDEAVIATGASGASRDPAQDAGAVANENEGQGLPTDAPTPVPTSIPEPTSTPLPTRTVYTPSGRNDDFTTADRIELPATIRGRTSPTSAPSFFAFTTAGEGQRTVQANWNAPGGDNCQVSFFGPGSRFLQRGRGAGGAFSVQGPAGQYYAAIQCGGVREYELNLDMAEP